MKSNSSATSMKEKHEKEGFWLDPKNHYWETEMYTEKGKEYLRKFVENKRKTTKLKDGKTLNRNHL